jgi:uncharacterized protein (DUF58 family)
VNPTVGARGEPGSSVFGYRRSLALLALLFFIAAANKARELAVFSGLVLGLMGALRLWGRLSLHRLEIRLVSPVHRLFPGEELVLRADLVNRKILPVRLTIELEASRVLAPLSSPEAALSLLPFERREGQWRFHAVRRGLHRLGPARVVAGDILGLYGRGRNLAWTEEVVVFPSLLALGPLDLAFGEYFGIHRSKGIIEDPAWYEGTREYTGNRPARNIHWKASARLDLLQEKIFQPTSQQKLLFILLGAGFQGEEEGPLFELALRVLASLATRFCETGASFGFGTDRRVEDFPAALPLGRGPEQLGLVLEGLARCGREAGQALAPLLSTIDAGGPTYIVVARAPDEAVAKFAARTATKRERRLFLFAEAGEGGEIDAYPSLVFSDLLPSVEAKG